MGRRASSSLNATAIVGIAVVVLILIGAGAVLLRSKKETFDGARLPIEEVFSSGANSLRRSDYVVEGKVDRREPRDSGLGIVIIVESGGEEYPLFIVVPDEVATINIDRDISYAFKVHIGDGGVPIATAVKRL